jgi:hypothetical protein
MWDNVNSWLFGYITLFSRFSLETWSSTWTRLIVREVSSDFEKRLYHSLKTKFRAQNNCFRVVIFCCKTVLKRISSGVWGWVKVKCTLVQALRLCTGHTAHRGSRGIAITFHDQGTRRGWEVSVTPRSLLNPGKEPVSIVQEAGWAPGPVWTGAEKSRPYRD